jgi:hypothetical protein
MISERDLNDLVYFRRILSDGNNFYRCSIFSYIEYNILNKNLVELKDFICKFSDIINNPLKGRDIQVNKFEIITIFYFITELLEKNDIEEAYKFFIKAYFIIENFDLVN